jgi:hypothetical protein
MLSLSGATPVAGPCFRFHEVDRRQARDQQCRDSSRVSSSITITSIASSSIIVTTGTKCPPIHKTLQQLFGCWRPTQLRSSVPPPPPVFAAPYARPHFTCWAAAAAVVVCCAARTKGAWPSLLNIMQIKLATANESRCLASWKTLAAEAALPPQPTAVAEEAPALPPALPPPAAERGDGTAEKRELPRCCCRASASSAVKTGSTTPECRSTKRSSASNSSMVSNGATQSHFMWMAGRS